MFLFTDIEGSTRLWEQQPEAMRAALARHDTHPAPGDRRGRRAGLQDRRRCVPCRVSSARNRRCQASLGRPAGAPGRGVGSARRAEPIQVRMALHTGAAEERDGDYFGPPLNRVARLLAAGHGGQILLSLAAQELVRDQLPRGRGAARPGRAPPQGSQPPRAYLPAQSRRICRPTSRRCGRSMPAPTTCRSSRRR